VAAVIAILLFLVVGGVIAATRRLTAARRGNPSEDPELDEAAGRLLAAAPTGGETTVPASLRAPVLQIDVRFERESSEPPDRDAVEINRIVTRLIRSPDLRESPLLLSIPAAAARFDRTYKARGRLDPDSIYQVNVARLECTCSEFVHRRARFPERDVRRVCDHLYDKLYQTKVETDFSELLRMFIRYARPMTAYAIATSGAEAYVFGHPFGPHALRILGVWVGGSATATYDFGRNYWDQDTLRANRVPQLVRQVKAALAKEAHAVG
jgi:hypothetical protein